MRSSERTVAASDGHELHLYVWEPEQPARALFYIAHGMAEHAGRYARLAQTLTDAGFVVYANDHRGHGKSIGEAGFGHVLDEGDGFDRIVEDLSELFALVSAEHATVPKFLLGHSMGTVIAQTFAGRDGKHLAGLVLSGATARPPTVLDFAGKPLLMALNQIHGARGTSNVMDHLAFGAFNGMMPQPTRTEYDWLSRDEAEVDKYIAEGLGFQMSLKFWADFLPYLQKLKAPEAYAGLPDNLPMLMLYGEADPVPKPPTGGHAVMQIQGELQAAKKAKPKVICYPDARHEIFNETNRDEVARDLVLWLEDTLSGRFPMLPSKL